MNIKKCIIIILVALSISAMCIDAYAVDEKQININNLTDYEYYSTFAEALQNHDYELVAQYIPCTDPKQFKYSGVTIKDYSVELIEDNDEYSELCAAHITLDITKSNDSFFPKGNTTYFAYINANDGMYGVFDFYPITKNRKLVSDKYIDGVMISVSIASYLTENKSASSDEITDMEYTEGFIHYFYHMYLQQHYPDGISGADLTMELNRFFRNRKNISKEVLDKLWKVDGLYFKQCGHEMPIEMYRCQRITRNKKTGYYTYDMWFYSDAAAMNVCRKIKFTYDISNKDYVLKKVNQYYSNDYEVMSL